MIRPTRRQRQILRALRSGAFLTEVPNLRTWTISAGARSWRVLSSTVTKMHRAGWIAEDGAVDQVLRWRTWEITDVGRQALRRKRKSQRSLPVVVA